MSPDPRLLVQATPELLDGWCGPVVVRDRTTEHHTVWQNGDARRHHGLHPGVARDLFDGAGNIASQEDASSWGCDLAAAVDGHPGDWMPHALTVDPAFGRAYRETWPVLQELSQSHLGGAR